MEFNSSHSTGNCRHSSNCCHGCCRSCCCCYLHATYLSNAATRATNCQQFFAYTFQLRNCCAAQLQQSSRATLAAAAATWLWLQLFSKLDLAACHLWALHEILVAFQLHLLHILSPSFENSPHKYACLDRFWHASNNCCNGNGNSNCCK